MKLPNLFRESGGQSLVEFSIAASLAVLLLLSVVEVGRMALVYPTVANSARVGLRYAMVHGSTRTGIGADGPSGPAANPTEVVTLVKNVARAGLIDTSRLIVTVVYPGASNAPGQSVNVTVVYPYDPWIRYLPLGVNLGSTSSGVIAF